MSLVGRCRTKQNQITTRMFGKVLLIKFCCRLNFADSTKRQRPAGTKLLTVACDRVPWFGSGLGVWTWLASTFLLTVPQFKAKLMSDSDSTENAEIPQHRWLIKSSNQRQPLPCFDEGCRKSHKSIETLSDVGGRVKKGPTLGPFVSMARGIH